MVATCGWRDLSGVCGAVGEAGPLAEGIRRVAAVPAGPDPCGTVWTQVEYNTRLHTYPYATFPAGALGIPYNKHRLVGRSEGIRPS